MRTSPGGPRSVGQRGSGEQQPPEDPLVEGLPDQLRRDLRDEIRKAVPDEGQADRNHRAVHEKLGPASNAFEVVVGCDGRGSRVAFAVSEMPSPADTGKGWLAVNGATSPMTDLRHPRTRTVRPSRVIELTGRAQNPLGHRSLGTLKLSE